MESGIKDASETSINLAIFFQSLARARQKALLLDYDGTLAPFDVDPAKALPYPGVREHLDAIMQDTTTRVVIISGRATKDLLPLLPLRRIPEVWGSHGWEQIATDGRHRMPEPDPATSRQLIETAAWAEQIKTVGGRIESKPAGIAIHWRGLTPEQITEICRLVVEHWTAEGLHRYLTWRDFDGGIELHAPGRHKGDVVNTILKEMGGAVAAYLGDDFTDEDAFRAIKGHGLGILVRKSYRPTAAELWLRPPEELLDFLDRWQRASDQR